MRNPYVAGGAATSYAGVARQSIIRNPYVAGAAAAGVATAGVYTDCEQTTDAVCLLSQGTHQPPSQGECGAF